jgi:hypothetical protein
MKLIEFNWNPTDRQLKQFGLAALVLLPFFGWIVTGKPRTLEAVNVPVIGGLAAAGLCLAVLALTKPQSIRLPFLALSLVTLPIGMVVGEIVLLVVYYAVFVPMGLFFRIIGRDALERQIDRRAPTYWQPKPQPKDVRSYYRQF